VTNFTQLLCHKPLIILAFIKWHFKLSFCEIFPQTSCWFGNVRILFDWILYRCFTNGWTYKQIVKQSLVCVYRLNVQCVQIFKLCSPNNDLIRLYLKRLIFISTTAWIRTGGLPYLFFLFSYILCLVPYFHFWTLLHSLTDVFTKLYKVKPATGP
jgi:hypothetical protein